MALTIVKAGLHGLAPVHVGGIVHRGFRPENIVVGLDGTSSLSGFDGTVRSGEPSSFPEGPASAYAAPEQFSGAPSTPAADVYAVAAVLYEMLTGRPPDKNAPIATRGVPRPLRPLIERGLAADPGARPEHAAMFITELDDAAIAGYGPDWEDRGKEAIVAGLSAAPPPPELSETPPTSRPPVTPPAADQATPPAGMPVIPPPGAPVPPVPGPAETIPTTSPTLLPPEPRSSDESAKDTAGIPVLSPTPKWFYAAMAGIAALAVALTAFASMPSKVPEEQPVSMGDPKEQTPPTDDPTKKKTSATPSPKPTKNPYAGKKAGGVLRPGSHPNEFQFARARMKAGAVVRVGEWIPVGLPSDVKIEEEVSGSRQKVELLEFRMFISRIREEGKKLTGVNAPMKVRFAKKGVLRSVYIAGGR